LHGIAAIFEYGVVAIRFFFASEVRGEGPGARGQEGKESRRREEEAPASAGRQLRK
jgi:hypothetical protein